MLVLAQATLKYIAANLQLQTEALRDLAEGQALRDIKEEEDIPLEWEAGSNHSDEMMVELTRRILRDETNFAYYHPDSPST